MLLLRREVPPVSHRNSATVTDLFTDTNSGGQAMVPIELPALPDACEGDK
ncbi:hypothetical protein GCM10011328_13310 [Hafnia psychrotolerans]|uniref:Uncharacterized protein n=1 Tax=Hafnia psychrotolerans TaxID=1477018 RepID=A0ABQ1GA48_9GAMM|nr:hypothetical protein GCM10011328_13310 [Hafnia psychrotolerans]